MSNIFDDSIDLINPTDPDVLFNNTPNFNSYSTLEDGIFHKINNHAEKLLGYSREELLGKSALDLGIWVNVSEREKTIFHVSVTGNVDNWEAQFRKKDGSIIHGRYSVTKLGKFVIFNVQDITKEKLRIEQEQAKDDNSLIGIITIDSENNIILANKRATEILKYSTIHEIINKNIHHLISDFANKVNTLDIENKLLKKKQSFETIISNNYGDKRLCKISISWFTDLSGKPGANIQFKDITDSIIMEKDLYIAIAKAEYAQHKAEEANQAKSQFLANMSHEIRTPMQTMSGALERLAYYIDRNPDKAKEYIQMFKLGLNSLSEHVNNVLDFSKIENTAIEIKNETFSLEQLLDNLLFYKLNAETKKIHYEVNKPD